MPRGRVLLLLSLIPVWLLLLSALPSGLASTWFTNQVNMAGIPLGIFLVIVAGALTLLGVTGVRSWRRPEVALVVFTIPAALFVIMGPALITITINLGSG
jgi:hypothetical protein